MKRSEFFLSAMLGLSLIGSPAYAQDAKKEESKPAAKKEAPVESVMKKPLKAEIPAGPTGPVKEWIDAENALIDPLADKDKESFFILRNKYSVIRVIGVVERDIGNAVKSCSDKNPSLKTEMNDRFTQWKNSVNPIVVTAKKQLERDIDAQKVVDPKKARDVMKLNDKAFEYTDGQVTKTPVTTVEACRDLLASMDRTEDNMVTLLQQTLLPESVIRKRSVDANKAEAKAKKAEAPKADDSAKAE